MLKVLYAEFSSVICYENCIIAVFLVNLRPLEYFRLLPYVLHMRIQFFLPHRCFLHNLQITLIILAEFSIKVRHSGFFGNQNTGNRGVEYLSTYYSLFFALVYDYLFKSSASILKIFKLISSPKISFLELCDVIFRDQHYSVPNWKIVV